MMYLAGRRLHRHVGFVDTVRICRIQTVPFLPAYWASRAVMAFVRPNEEIP